MKLDELDKIAWWTYSGGILYALVVGQLLIPKVVKNMYELVEPDFADVEGLICKALEGEVSGPKRNAFGTNVPISTWWPKRK